MADDDKSKEQEEENKSTDTEDDKRTEDDDKNSNPDAAKWRELARKHERESKARAKKLQEIEDANKTDAQKHADTAAAEKKRADDAEARALRAEVAGDKGLPRKLWQFLSASTQEDLEAQADALLEATGASDDKGKPGNKPTERLRGGGDPTDEPEEMDPAKLAAKVPRF